MTIDNLIYIGRVPAGHRRGICRFPYDNLPSIGGWDIYATLNIDWASGSGRMNVRAIQKNRPIWWDVVNSSHTSRKPRFREIANSPQRRKAFVSAPLWCAHKQRILACGEFAIPRNGKMSRRRAGAVRAPYGRRRILVIFWGIANSSQSGSKEITRSYILAAAYRTSETSEASRSHRKVIWRWQLGARTGILRRPLTAQCWVMYL